MKPRSHSGSRVAAVRNPLFLILALDSLMCNCAAKFAAVAAPRNDGKRPQRLCERKRSNPEPIARREWIASSLALPCANASRLSQAMTEESPCAKTENSPSTSTRFHLSSRPLKNFPLRFSPKSNLYPPPSRPHLEGRIAIVTDVGHGMRWTRQCRETNGADPASLKLRRDATEPVVRLFRRRVRTAKSCGPDASTLVSSWRRCFASRR
jgi:hypothetical protein